MTKNLKWRLNKLPTPDEVRELVKDKIITQDEARDILFSQEQERDVDSLQAEIKFLRELVNKLSTSRTKIVEEIRYIQQPYIHWNWYKPYDVYCSTVGIGTQGSITTGYSYNNATLTASSTGLNTGNSDYTDYDRDVDSFTDIKTF